MSTHPDAAEFDAYYYRHCLGGEAYARNRSWMSFFGAVADRIVVDMAPRRALDAGCALGFLVESLRDWGVDASGIDISSYAIAHVHPRVQPYCRQASIVEELGGSYDLIVSIEVLEHMPLQEGERAIVNICTHTDDVLFSSTPFDRKELSHVNVQPPEYWAEQFARQGFYRDVDFDASFVTPWAVRFRKRDEPTHRIVRDYERRLAMLEIERHEVRKRGLELQSELARYRAPVMQKLKWLVRRWGGRVLRPFY